MNNEMETDKKIMEFNNFGVKISIDDFGTGYSSFGYLKRFPVDRLKIDKHLIDTIEVEHNEFHIVKAIIVMSKALGLKVIAEGVETREQLEKLKELECDQVQGYYYSKPIKVVDFEKYIEESINKKMTIIELNTFFMCPVYRYHYNLLLTIYYISNFFQGYYLQFCPRANDTISLLAKSFNTRLTTSLAVPSSVAIFLWVISKSLLSLLLLIFLNKNDANLLSMGLKTTSSTRSITSCNLFNKVLKIYF